MRILKLIAVSIALLLIGGVLGYQYEHVRVTKFFNSFRPIRNAIPNYQYTAPLLGHNSDQATEIGYYEDTKAAIENAAQAAQRENKLLAYSVYFRDLNTPFWFGVHEDAVFLPASLFKLPIAMIVYKEVEDGVVDPKKLLTYKPTGVADPLQTASSLVAGKTYTFYEFIRKMFEESDIGAKDLFGTLIHDDYVAQLWAILELGKPHVKEEISVEDYSFFFRMLYSSTYLDSEHSENVLKMLAGDDYRAALVAGVPSGVPVSHKWGLYNLTEDGISNTLELHDCGIVYAPDNPYLLCVMTKGTTQKDLETFIATVSSIVYSSQSQGK